ncbi:MAG: 30S ribosomal protein S2 [Chloroflexota bacterium]
MAAKVSMKELLEAGVHFGHRTRRWNPKMRPYIFTERSNVHIIDLQQTMIRLNQYAEMVRKISSEGGTVLFVGTKRQAQAAIQQEADRCGMPYINIRWLGGTLTNWSTIRQRINHLIQMERRVNAGEFQNLSKKEQLEIDREIAKLNRRLGGLKGMDKLPNLIFVVDTNLEDLAVREATKLKIPIMGMVDTNCNPDPIDYIIPCNDDAIRSIKLIVSVIASAAEEGQNIRAIDEADSGRVSRNELDEMKQYLGPSTLAKLQVDEEESDVADADDADIGAAMELIADDSADADDE